MLRAAGFFVLMMFAGIGLAATARAVTAEQCPIGNPSPDGAQVVPGSACVLHDAAGNAWAFADAAKLNNTIMMNDKPVGSGIAIAIDRQGKAFVETQSCQYPLWQLYAPDGIYSSFHQEIAPSAPPIAPPFTIKSGEKIGRYYSMRSAAISLKDGDLLEIGKSPGGIPVWQQSGRVNAAGVTIDGAGARLACATELSQGAIAAFNDRERGANGGNLTVKNIDIGFNQAPSYDGPYTAIQIDTGFRAFTLIDSNLHDSDMCLLMGGGNGEVVLKNNVFSHCGSARAGSGAGFNHNVYLSWNGANPDTDRVTISGGRSVDVTHEGDPLKLRFANGRITNFTVGCTGAFDDCEPNWPVDIPCGGNYTLSRMVIERGPKASNYGMVRYGEEQAIKSNCPAGGRTYSLMLDHVTLIDDGPSDSHHLDFAVCAGRETGTTCENSGYRLVVKDSIIISNPKAGRTRLGANVVDGGGNRFFASREGAGLKPYPFLPGPL